MASMNPVLRKDLLQLLRLRSVAAVQVVLLLVLSLVVIGTWPEEGVVSFAAQAQDRLLTGLLLGQLLLMLLIIPAAAAVSITGEVEANTLEMLYSSRLSATQIIIGKVLTALSLPGLLLACGLPFAGMLYFRGSVDLGLLARGYLILILGVVLVAMISLTVSAFCRQSGTALTLAYLLVLSLCGAVLVPAAIMLATQEGLVAKLLHYVRAISPVAALLAVVRPIPGEYDGQGHSLLSLDQVFVPLSAILIVLCFLAICVRLRLAPGAMEVEFRGTVPVAHRRIQRLLTLIDSSKPPKPFGRGNPVMIKEARTSVLRSSRWMLRTFYGTLVLSLGLAGMSLYGGTEHADLLNDVAVVITTLQLSIIALINPGLASSVISSERESDTLEALRLTPLRPGDLFLGKLVPTALPTVLPLLAMLPAFLTLAFIDRGFVPYLSRLIPVLLLAAISMSIVGFVCSCFIRTSTHATVASYIITSALFLLPAAGWWLLQAWVGSAQAAWVAMPSPLAMSLSLVDRRGFATPVSQLCVSHLLFVGGASITLLFAALWRIRGMLRGETQ